MWDVIASCEIKGSSDSSITNVEVNDLKKIIDQSQITHIYTKQKTQKEFFNYVSFYI